MTNHTKYPLSDDIISLLQECADLSNKLELIRKTLDYSLIGLPPQDALSSIIWHANMNAWKIASSK